MKQVMQDVYDFHRAMNQAIGRTPAVPDEPTIRLRLRLVNEEFDELMDAISRDDVADTADACADLIYVIAGTAVAYGVDLAPIWAEVQRANMAKAGGPVREDGKRGKPPGWKAPDIAGLLAVQGDLRATYGEGD